MFSEPNEIVRREAETDHWRYEPFDVKIWTNYVPAPGDKVRLVRTINIWLSGPHGALGRLGGPVSIPYEDGCFTFENLVFGSGIPQFPSHGNLPVWTTWRVGFSLFINGISCDNRFLEFKLLE